MVGELPRSVVAPRAPDPEPPRRFPLVATLAPLVAALALFALTRSVFTLGFALLGPIVAIASVADAALHRRRARGVSERRFVAELRRATREIDEAHGAELAELNRANPGVRELLLGEHGPTVAWRGGGNPSPEKSVVVRIGSTDASSALRLTASDHGTSEVDADPRLAELESRAGILRRAPAVLEVGSGVGLVGPMMQTAALARGILLQIAAQFSPAGTEFAAPPDSTWDWLGDLPHPVTRVNPAGIVEVRGHGHVMLVAVSDSVAGLPAEAAVVIRVGGDGLATVSSGTAVGVSGGILTDFLGREEAISAATALGSFADRTGVTPEPVLPAAVALATLEQSEAMHGLAATIGVDARGPFVVDLVRDGAHAIVGGTTGSGKSELLVTWVLAMAAERSPSEVTFLFVDFKGGAAFDPLLALPHCVGVITDLDEEHSLRALASLAAELRHRERMLAARGMRSIDDNAPSAPFPRLVVVIDEYAALVETHSSLHSVFADIAARGRSLGVHLVLCTQRPAGVVRDNILANCPLRLSLRVLTPADSAAVLGTDAAAQLASAPAGRALVGTPGIPARPVQIALADEDSRDRVIARWTGCEPPRVPWLPPLPAKIGLEALANVRPDDGIPFALEDRPEQQAQDPALYLPATHGSLAIVGAARSGKSGVLAALAAAPSTVAVELLPRDWPQLWDALRTVLALPAAHSGAGRLLLLDDADVAISAADETYQPVLLELLGRTLREGRTSGIHLALTMQRITGSLQSLVALCGETLVLRMPNRQEHVLAGGAASGFYDGLPAGAGFWRGHRVQVFDAPVSSAGKPSLLTTEPDLASAVFAAVSTQPEQFAERLRAAVPERGVVVLGPARFDPRSPDSLSASTEFADILVADPETWQSHWTAFVALQRSANLLFDGCSLTELRALIRSRDLPPPFPRGQRALWWLPRDGEVARVRLPGRHEKA